MTEEMIVRPLPRNEKVAQIASEEFSQAMAVAAIHFARMAFADNLISIDIRGVGESGGVQASPHDQIGIDDMAEMYGCSYGTAQRLMARLPKQKKYKVGRKVYILRKDLEEYVKAHGGLHAKRSSNGFGRIAS